MSWLMYATRSTMRTIPLVGVGLGRSRVREDAVADLAGQVQRAGDAKRLLVVPEATPEASFDRLVECVFSGVAEGRVAHVVPEADRLDEVLVQAESPADHAADGGGLEGVCHPGAIVVALRVDEDLRLPFQPPERLGMDDPVTIPLERRPYRARLLLALTPACLVRAHGNRGQKRLLVLAAVARTRPRPGLPPPSRKRSDQAGRRVRR